MADDAAATARRAKAEARRLRIMAKGAERMRVASSPSSGVGAKGTYAQLSSSALILCSWRLPHCSIIPLHAHEHEHELKH